MAPYATPQQSGTTVETGIEPTAYRLQCLETGEIIDDTAAAGGPMTLACPRAEGRAFLRTVYAQRQISVGADHEGIYRFGDWLPLQRRLLGSSAPVTYKSEGLAEALGLDELYVTFSGYWPEKGVQMHTGTFKECEAYSVCARMSPETDRTLVVASAGNTARAFMRVCSENEIPLVICIPEENLEALWSVGPIAPCVKVIAAGGNADYTDAIRLAGLISGFDGFMPEGGARNVARRDGMGTTMLSAVNTIGRIPDYYFQAVGSGTGAIAAWEANLRLLRDGRFGNHTTRLVLSQNSPFLLLHDSWKRGRRDLLDIEESKAKEQIHAIRGKVLSNRTPPYSVRGGLFDALTETDGIMLAVDNDQADRAMHLFHRTEGIDLAPAASVAVASLVEARRSGMVGRDDVVVLNVTGGGYARIFADYDLVHARPDAIIDKRHFSEARIREVLSHLFER
ncbi:MAG: cysteate synthase [Spirochaetaceae bacterium]